MASFTFNIAKGRVKEYYARVKNNDPAASVLRVFAVQAGATPDDTIKDFDTQAAIFGGGVTEASNAGYAHKVLSDTELDSVPAPDDTNNTNSVSLPTLLWSAVQAAGGAWTDLLVVFDPDGSNTAANNIPLTFHDFAVTPEGTDIALNATTFFTAQDP